MKITRTKNTITVTADTKSLNQLVNDLHRLKRLDGQSFTVQLKARPPMMRMLKPIPSLRDIMRDALAKSHQDIYRGQPEGQPFPERVKTATVSARAELQKALAGQENSLVLTRKEALKAFNHQLMRSPVGRIWRKAVLDKFLES